MPACGSVTPPAFCARAWCYVLATCVVSYSYDGFVDTALSNVTRSYETCGQLPSDQSETIINETLSSQPLRVLLLNNSAGWTGSYLDQNGATVLNHETFAPGDAPAVSYIKSVTANVGVSLQFVDPRLAFPAHVRDLAQVEPAGAGTAVPEQICALAASLCYVDLCIGDTLLSGDASWLGRCLNPSPSPIVTPLARAVRTE